MKKGLASLLLVIGILVYSQAMASSDTCDLGYEMARAGSFREAVPVLSDCVNSQTASGDKRRLGYLARAWAYKNLDDPRAAVRDQEKAFKLPPEPAYTELINYALYLRAAGRARDSLAPLRSAEAIDQANGWTSMMTQYHVGWSYQELGQHEKAIVAFSKGIPAQSDFAFAYYRRGLSYEALGQKNKARADFEKVGVLIKTPSRGNTAENELPELRRKLREYGLE